MHVWYWLSTIVAILSLVSGWTMAAPATQPSTPTVLSMHSVDDRLGDECVDLDEAAAQDMPPGAETWNRQRTDWLSQAGIDLLIDHESSGSWTILAWNSTIVPVQNELWDRDAAWVKRTLPVPAHTDDWLHLRYGLKNTPPLTFAFRTRSGTFGLLRITAIVQVPGWTAHVEIRRLPAD